MATIQEILEMNQGGVGRASSDVQFLIQSIRDKMKRAKERDVLTAQAYGSGGKAGIYGAKHLRDFQIAQRANPDLSFWQFMRDPATSAKYVKTGTELISSGKRAPLGFGESVNPWSKRHLQNPNMQTLSDLAQKDTSAKLSQEMAGLQQEALHQKTLQDLAGAQESIGSATGTKYRSMYYRPDFNAPQTNVASTYQPSPSIDQSGISGLSAQDARRKLQEVGYSGDLASIRSGYSTSPTASPFQRDVTGETLEQLLSAGQPSLAGLSSGAGVNLPTAPSELAQNVFQPRQLNPFSAGASSLKQGLAPISAGGAEVAGEAIPTTTGAGGLSSALSLGSGLYGMARGGATPSNIGSTLSGGLGAASLAFPPLAPVLGPLSIGTGLLSTLFGSSKYNR